MKTIIDIKKDKKENLFLNFDEGDVPFQDFIRSITLMESVALQVIEDIGLEDHPIETLENLKQLYRQGIEENPIE